MISCIPREEPADGSFLLDLIEESRTEHASQDPSNGPSSSSSRIVQRPIKSSSYGAAAPYKPSWAKKLSKPTPSKIATWKLITDTAPYTFSQSESRELEVDGHFFGDGAAGSPPASSKLHLPAGSISTLRYSHTGDLLGVASHDGSVFSVPVRVFVDQLSRTLVRAKSSAVTGLGSGVGASLRTVNPVTSLSTSFYEYRGLDARLRQAGAKGPGLATGLDSSVSCRLLLGCGGGEERCAWLWAARGRGTPILRFQPDKVGRGAGTGAVTSCALFYLDRFALLASGNRITAAGFSLGQDAQPAAGQGTGTGGGRRPPADDFNRLKRKFCGDARAWTSTSWVASGDGSVASGATTTVTHVAAHNTFRSPLVFSACSDRSVRVYDTGMGGGVVEALRIPDAHSRPVHTLSLPEACSYSDVPPVGLDCFVTASTDAIPGGPAGGAGGSNGLVRLWDLRSGQCARQLAGGHSNSRHCTGAALSPDLLYCAVGSEDRCVTVYDLRTCRHVAKLRGASDTVTAVAWHPRTEHLIAGSLDGGVRAHAPHAHKMAVSGASQRGAGGGGGMVEPGREGSEAEDYEEGEYEDEGSWDEQIGLEEAE